MSEMEVIVDPKTREALSKDGTLRCLLQTRYTPDDRTSVAVIPWARRKATKVSRNILQDAGLGAETATFTVELNGYRLGGRNHRSFICYDIYLEKCSREARNRIERSTRQPIHLITSMANVFHVRRAQKCDIKVALFFETIRDGKHLNQPLNQFTVQNIGDHAQNKLERIIQDAAGEITRYIGGASGEDIINQLDLQLYITKAMISDSEDHVENFIVKDTDPVAEKDARFAVANTISFLISSFRAQRRTESFKNALEHSVEMLKEEIRSRKSVKNSASEAARMTSRNMRQDE